ncbi:MAG: glutamine--fructose-6-phosphate transaminase (isomerizing) [Planctomycetota bacterium]|nr:glutamine--fructose-6-phosphate transaminase (isomerizing) [Planctomycetota bacterium]MCX8039498.1 glutamine--fructose-6-phosphate transaminase (isomerizing) [Planctomycetota bacterium]MDW8373016.1 glutamine--fructose-6-phosphate transaminase (isomerizing) [Planctomycetota bacterium]
MCGIAGYLGPKDAAQVLLVALERLKYRGYDSAGLAVSEGGSLHLRRAAGKLQALSAKLDAQPVSGHCGIAHTRWATHGPPEERNSHPHLSYDGRIAVVHNGIIENHAALRRDLEADGVRFASDTDTEVIPHLLAKHYDGKDPLQALLRTLAMLEGAFAIAVAFADRTDRLLAARKGSPLLIGRGRDRPLRPGTQERQYTDGGTPWGERELLIASDLPALLPHASEYLPLEDGEIADLGPHGVRCYDFRGERREPRWRPVEITASAVSKGNYDSFMAKEIAEQPEVLARLIDSRLRDGRLVQPDLGIDLATIRHVVFLACGTSWHAALLGKRFLENLARVHVEVDISSEYRYRNPVAAGNTLVVAISQSGETADTLAGLRLAKSKFLPVVGLVNVVTSTIARESDGVLPLLAGPEIGVASTKAYTAQVMALYLFAAQIARAKGLLPHDAEDSCIAAARAMPDLVARTLQLCEPSVEECADLYAAAQATVFLGRGGEHPTALEGALKLKEIAYVHAVGYPAGEFKHGPIALVTRHLPVVCICPRDAMYEKMLSNIQEVKARAGRIIAVGDGADRDLRDLADQVLPVLRASDELLQPILSILPLQRYAYRVARLRDCDVDQPRNLAKSVTVE